MSVSKIGVISYPKNNNLIYKKAENTDIPITSNVQHNEIMSKAASNSIRAVTFKGLQRNVVEVVDWTKTAEVLRKEAAEIFEEFNSIIDISPRKWKNNIESFGHAIIVKGEAEDYKSFIHRNDGLAWFYRHHSKDEATHTQTIRRMAQGRDLSFNPFTDTQFDPKGMKSRFKFTPTGKIETYTERIKKLDTDKIYFFNDNQEICGQVTYNRKSKKGLFTNVENGKVTQEFRFNDTIGNMGMYESKDRYKYEDFYRIANNIIKL